MSAAGSVRSFIALGANLGDAVLALRHAVVAIDALPQTTLLAASSIYKTAPMAAGPGGQVEVAGDDYFNAVVEVETSLKAPQLLIALQQLEQAAGRERPYIGAPRTLDLDLLLYGSASIESKDLLLPHPRMRQRAFVLVPLAEIAADLVTAEELAAVGHQRIQRLDSLSLRT